MASNKAPGIDRIPIRVIKDSLGSILPVLTSVVNTSIAINMFPTQWKLAEVTPIPKDTDYEQASNNRPILLPPIVLKVCERVVYNKFALYHHILHQRGGRRTIKAETRNSIQQKRPSLKQQT